MIKEGSKVAINYTLTVDGAIADSSQGREPLEYVQGEGQIIVGLEEALAGLKAGDKKSVNIAAAKAYGTIVEEAKKMVPKTSIQNIDKLKVGDMVGASSGGQTFRAVIGEITDSEVMLDFNHPLAGKELHFDVEVVSVA